MKQFKFKHQNVFHCDMMNLTMLFPIRKEAGYFMSISLSMSYLRNISNTSKNCQQKSLIHIASKQSVDFVIITGWQTLDLSVVQFINKP